MTVTSVPDRGGDPRRRPKTTGFKYNDPKTCKHTGFGGSENRDSISGCPNCNKAVRGLAQDMGKLFGGF
jgi:hypothetical protein